MNIPQFILVLFIQLQLYFQALYKYIDDYFDPPCEICGLKKEPKKET